MKISLSTDGGLTYPHVLAASTPNDGSEAVTIPHFATSSARVKIEALGNVFFDVSNANFTITDTLKPTITASVAPPANAAGWHKSNVTVTLTATDDANGSGIKSITYSATGAQPIQSTTVNAASTNVVITTNGITTLSYFATDNEGNTSDVGMTTVKLDKVAPEAYLQFDPVKRDIAVFGRDGLSGTPAGPLTPSRVQRVPSGDKNLRVEIRTYDLADAAGNTLQLVHSVGLTKNDAVAGIQTLQYNGGAVVRPVYNVMFFDWKLKQNALDELHQEFLVISPLQRATADWRAKDNRTLVWSLAGGRHDSPGPLPPPARDLERRAFDRDHAVGKRTGGPAHAAGPPPSSGARGAWAADHRSWPSPPTRAIAGRPPCQRRARCSSSGFGLRLLEQHCENEPGQQSEDDRSARAEDRELLLDVSRDHVRRDEPANRPGRWVRYRPPERARDPVSREHQRLQHANTDPRDGTHEDDVPSAYPVIDEAAPAVRPAANPSVDRHDPEPRNSPPEGEPLCSTDNHARDRDPDERRPHGIDSIHG